MQLRDRARWALAVLLSMALLSAPAVWNRFALLQYDTGGYLARWYELYLVPSRAVVWLAVAALAAVPLHEQHQGLRAKEIAVTAQ